MKTALILAFTCLATLATTARAEIDLSFSGGSNSPLSITLDTPLTYVITSDTNNNAPLFVFKGVGDLFGGTPPANISTITYTDNGGPAITLDAENSGFTNNSFNADDLYLYPSAVPGVEIGDVIVLSPGSITTLSDFTAAAPLSGLYQSFIYDGEGNALSLGATIPEPSTWELTFGGLVILAFFIRRRQLNA